MVDASVHGIQVQSQENLIQARAWKQWHRSMLPHLMLESVEIHPMGCKIGEYTEDTKQVAYFWVSSSTRQAILSPIICAQEAQVQAPNMLTTQCIHRRTVTSSKQCNIKTCWAVLSRHGLCYAVWSLDWTLISTAGSWNVAQLMITHVHDPVAMNAMRRYSRMLLFAWIRYYPESGYWRLLILCLCDNNCWHVRVHLICGL